MYIHTQNLKRKESRIQPFCLRFYPVSVSLCNLSSLVQGLGWLNSRSV